MKFSKEIYDELNLISPLVAGMDKINVFSVPEGYFDILYLAILTKVNEGKKASDTTKLAVPEGYFENLTSSILNKIRQVEEIDDPAKELRELSPMLYSIQNENVFKVPSGYFRNLEYNLVDAVKPQAPVVQLKKRDPIWKFAAAAVVTGFIGLSSLLMFNNSGNKLNEGSISTAIQQATKYQNENQVKAAIATLSDDEIIKYLERTGNDVDNELLTTSVDDQVLPAPNDYLMDEKLLDSYLEPSAKDKQN